MARYIDADKLKEYLHREDFYTPDERWKPESEFANMIDATPTADVEEVRHGEWIAYGLMNPQCSLCHKYNYEKSRFCPHCGARMDGGKNENLL
jgi:NADH pyrophosphatase NudC (nudix superfamily)